MKDDIIGNIQDFCDFLVFLSTSEQSESLQLD